MIKGFASFYRGSFLWRACDILQLFFCIYEKMRCSSPKCRFTSSLRSCAYFTPKSNSKVLRL